MKRSSWKNTTMLLILAMTCMIVCANSKPAHSTEDPSSTTLAPRHFKIAHEETPEGDQHVYCTKFKEYLEKATNGAYTCDIYTAGQLGDNMSQSELVQQGAIEIGFNSNGPLAALVPEANILNLHYIMPTEIDDYQDLLHTGQSIKALEDILYKKNLKIIDWTHAGYSYWTTNKEIRTSADWKGVKFRVMATPIIMRSFEAYGANATPVSYSETYSALQLHMVDGQTNPLSCIKDMKFYEVQDYLINPKAEYMTYTFMMNTAAWESLPPEGQRIFLDVAARTNVEYNKYATARYKSLIDFFVQEGLTYVELSADEIEAFRKLAGPVRKEYVKTCGDRAGEVLDLILKDIEKYN